MASFKKVLDSFIGGSEKYWDFSFIDDDGLVFNLTGFTITAELHWEGCSRLTLSVDDGVEVLDAHPDEPAPHEYPDAQVRITLDESKTDCIPVGKDSYLTIHANSPDDVMTIFGPFHLDRRA